ncbi:MAG: aminotransferase class IV [Bdellovibrionales bacterium]
MKELVSVNGLISAPQDAMVSVYDRGFLFGDAIYEVTRTYGDVLFGLEPHIDRLFRSADSIGMDIGRTKEELIEEMYELVAEGGESDIYIRVQVSRGTCAFEQVSLKPKNTGPANIVMYLHKLQAWDPIYYSRGIRLSSSSIIRNSKSAMDPNIKSGNYLNNILSLLNSTENSDFDDVILLNSDNKITEGTTFNIFMVKDSKVITNSDDSDILQGITRSIVFDCIRKEGMDLEIKDFNLQDLKSADEAFITSSTKEVMPVFSVDGKNIANSPGALTLQLAKSYSSYVESYCKKALVEHPIKVGK